MPGKINGFSRNRGLEEKDRGTVHGKGQTFQGRRGDTKPSPQPPKKSRQIPWMPTQFQKQKFQRSQDSDYSRENSPHFHLKQGLPV